MNKRNITGHKQVLVEISKTRNAFTELDDFFRKADENIANLEHYLVILALKPQA